MECPSCKAEVLDIDVRCGKCGAALGATGAHRMLGSTVLGQYELVDVLGQGGMSVVFKGKHKLTDQEVALKILPPELAAHSQVKSRFLEEAKALAALDHGNIVHLYNFGQENGCFVLAMQYVQGVTWERMILENKRLDWKSSLKITCDVLRALEYAHSRGIVHRDMKPSNVLVRQLDGSATVMDFGIAKMTTSTKLTATGQTMGTVRYMSPEQVRGQDVDLRTDIYSLGATLYESLTGDTPFDGQTHFEIMTKHLSEAPKRPSVLGIEVPAIIEDAMMRSLSKRAEDRFDSAREMRKIFEQALKEGDVGLLETQKVDRSLLDRKSPTSAPTKQLAPASSSPEVELPRAAALADSLEPGDTGLHKKSRKLGWVVLAGVVVAGGAAATILLVSSKDKPVEGYQPLLALEGVKLVAGHTFGDLAVETDGNVTADEVHNAYEAALADLRAFRPTVEGTPEPPPDPKPQPKDPKRKLPPPKPPTMGPPAGAAPRLEPVLEIPSPNVQEIAAIPRAAFCVASTYKMMPADHLDASGSPPDCKTASFELTFAVSRVANKREADQVLLVLSDRKQLAESMKAAIGKIACTWQARPETADAICARVQAWSASRAGIQ